jgi:hypothetical protein
VLYGCKHWTLKEARYKDNRCLQVMVVEKIAQNTMDSKKEAGGLLFKLYYPSFPMVHGKKANIIADILMPLHSINLSVVLVMHIRMYYTYI